MVAESVRVADGGGVVALIDHAAAPRGVRLASAASVIRTFLVTGRNEESGRNRTQ